MHYKNSYIGSIFLLIVLFVFPQQMHGQTVNTGTMVITEGTEVSTLFNFENKTSGDLINDGSFYIYSNWHNDGLVSFTPEIGSGLTLFQGRYGKQRITGSMPSEFYDILLDNPAQQPAFELSGDIMIWGRAEFNNGIIDGNDFGGLVSFQSEASHRKVGDHSFVDGPVYKEGNENFIYPIGDQEIFRMASIAKGGEISDGYTAQYFLQNSNAQHPHLNKEVIIDLIDDAEYWVVDRTVGNSDIVLTLSWDERTTPSELLVDKTGQELHIVRWDDGSQMWVDEGGVSNEEQRIVTTAVSGFGVFTLAKVLVEDTPEENLIVYNGLSPNGDGRNDFFYIKGIELYPDNTVEIYNRWGVKVFETKGYDNQTSRFDGYSHGRATFNSNEKLPVGTYFYIIKYKDGNSMRDLSGYLYINQ